MWADHGDAISLQYSGSHALKGDLTRTGKRTVGGLLQVLSVCAALARVRKLCWRWLAALDASANQPLVG